MKRDLVFEIGVEEIPSAPLYDAIAQLKSLATSTLGEYSLAFEDVRTYGSPRRLVLAVDGLAAKQKDRTTRHKGPAAKAAFGSDGAPTPAAAGFARSKGLDVSALEVGRDENGGEYVYAVVEQTGRETGEVLPEMLSRLAQALDWPKSMRWGSGETRFSRPVRWLLALYGHEVVDVEFAGLRAGRVTHGHRFLAPGPIDVPTAEEYPTAVGRGLVQYDHEARARTLRESIDAAARKMDATAVVHDKTFAEVVNLVEYPTVGVGRFDEEFLSVPREVLVTAMESHQRYFPLEARGGELLNAFVVAHNGDPARTDEIVAGHERVIRARLADAAFFYREDLSSSLEEYVGKLDGIVFQEKLGSLGAKVRRVEELARKIAEISEVGPEAGAAAVRAAHLCKADLVSHVVVEFPALQGVMGREYALASGESERVADAIFEHYMPRYAGDAVPPSQAGRVLSAADKLDTICGIFAIGMAPTGSADPYALRRSALGVLSIQIDGELAIGLDAAISAALEGYQDALEGLDSQQTGRAVKEFVVGRLEGVLRDRGHAYDTVSAVLAVADDDPSDAISRCAALTPFRSREEIADLSVAFTRARNLSVPQLGTECDAAIMGTEEAALADALAEAEERAVVSLDAGDYRAALGVLAGLRGPIDAFFDSVLVMDEDEVLRNNRLRLLNRFVALFERFADFSRLAG